VFYENEDKLISCIERVALSLERANELKEIELALLHPDWAKTKRTPLDKPAKLMSFSVAKPEEWNEEYERKQRERLAGR
jgi:hypothetical protein